MRKSSFVLVLGRRNLLVFLILQQSRVTLKYCQLRSTTKKKQFFPASAFFGVCLNLFCKGRKNKTKRLKTHRSILVHNNCDLCKTEYCPMFHSSVRPTRAFIIRLILLCQDIQIWFNRWKSHSQCCCQFSISPGA